VGNYVVEERQKLIGYAVNLASIDYGTLSTILMDPMAVHDSKSPALTPLHRSSTSSSRSVSS